MTVEAERAPRSIGWGLGTLFGPSVLLLPVLAVYVRYKAPQHFFVHTLMGWDLALSLLLTATFRGWPRSRWDGVLPLGLALVALTPDFIYAAGPYHRDWMDVFLFHPSLDELLPYSLLALAVEWAILLAGYLYFRLSAFVK